MTYLTPKLPFIRLHYSANKNYQLPGILCKRYLETIKPK